MIDFPTYARLEPARYEKNLQQGFAAAVHDPVWFLARQWQMGELRGENASTPTWVHYVLTSHPITSGDERYDPTIVPAEAVVESEIDDWWTVGRRVRIGRQVSRALALPDDPDLRLRDLPPPYESFNGQYDGRALWRQRGVLGLQDSLFGEIPPEPQPAWSSSRLLYQQTESNSFAIDGQWLIVQDHHGGQLDWYGVDASPGGAGPAPLTESGEAIPTPLDYPGAPTSRWWQFENAAVDPGAYVPDDAHAPTAILTELIFSHGDDWFLFPVRARAGHVVALQSLKVTDAFGREYDSESRTGPAPGKPLWKGLLPPEKWTLFQTAGAAPGTDGLQGPALVLWHLAEQPLESLPVERVQFGVDETVNLVWAVERVVQGREVASRDMGEEQQAASPKYDTSRSDDPGITARQYVYIPGQGAATYWHPYELVPDNAEMPRRLVRRQLLDLSRQRPQPLPEPQALVLQPASGATEHYIEPQAVPSNGIELQRRWLLARDMNGQPILWIQRQRHPLLAPPARTLRFDVMLEAVEKSGTPADQPPLPTP